MVKLHVQLVTTKANMDLISQSTESLHIAQRLDDDKDDLYEIINYNFLCN